MDTRDRIDVRYVADLARLRLTAEEEAELQSQLEEIVGYVEKLAELDVEGIEPTAHATLLTNVFRPDEARPTDLRQALLENAPRAADGHIIVPKVIE